MKQCRNCGSALDDSLVFCPYCGKPLDGGTQPNAYGAQGNMPYGNRGNAYGAPAGPYNGQGNMQGNPYGGTPNNQGNAYNAFSGNQGNAYGAPTNPYAGQRGINPQMSNKKMPTQGVYLTLVIIGFICGILWGVLAMSPYKKMKEAIAANDAEEANANAKKILTFVVIGIIINALVITGKLAQS